MTETHHWLILLSRQLRRYPAIPKFLRLSSITFLHLLKPFEEFTCYLAATIVGFNPFMPSVPKNGTPSLTANYKIIQALMG